MEKKLLFACIMALVFNCCYARTADVQPRIREFTAVVENFSPGRLMLYSKRKNHTYHHRYTVTGATQIVGTIRPGVRAKVSYYLKRMGSDRLVKIAVKVEVLPAE